MSTIPTPELASLDPNATYFFRIGPGPNDVAQGTSLEIASIAEKAGFRTFEQIHPKMGGFQGQDAIRTATLICLHIINGTVSNVRKSKQETQNYLEKTLVHNFEEIVEEAHKNEKRRSITQDEQFEEIPISGSEDPNAVKSFSSASSQSEDYSSDCEVLHLNFPTTTLLHLTTSGRDSDSEKPVDFGKTKAKVKRDSDSSLETVPLEEASENENTDPRKPENLQLVISNILNAHIDDFESSLELKSELQLVRTYLRTNLSTVSAQDLICQLDLILEQKAYIATVQHVRNSSSFSGVVMTLLCAIPGAALGFGIVAGVLYLISAIAAYLKFNADHELEKMQNTFQSSLKAKINSDTELRAKNAEIELTKDEGKKKVKSNKSNEYTFSQDYFPMTVRAGSDVTVYSSKQELEKAHNAYIKTISKPVANNFSSITSRRDGKVSAFSQDQIEEAYARQVYKDRQEELSKQSAKSKVSLDDYLNKLNTNKSRHNASSVSNSKGKSAYSSLSNIESI